MQLFKCILPFYHSTILSDRLTGSVWLDAYKTDIILSMTISN